MRRLALVLALGASAFLMQPSGAYSYYVTVKMSRAGATAAIAADDAYTCRWNTSRRAGHMRPTREDWVGLFIGCMQKRGYQLDPNGFEVGKFDRIWVPEYAKHD